MWSFGPLRIEGLLASNLQYLRCASVRLRGVLVTAEPQPKAFYAALIVQLLARAQLVLAWRVGFYRVGFHSVFLPDASAAVDGLPLPPTRIESLPQPKRGQPRDCSCPTRYGAIKGST